MYDLRYTNPRLAGNVYRSSRTCGKSNCKCASDKKYWHPYYYLTYTQRVKGKSIHKWEYIPKSKVKALKQRIKRAKAKSYLLTQKRKWFLREVNQLANLLEHHPSEDAILNRIERLLGASVSEPPNEVERGKTIESLANLISALHKGSPGESRAWGITQ